MTNPKKLRNGLIALLLTSVVALIGVEVCLRLVPSVLPEQVQIKIHWRELLGETTHSVAHEYCGFTYKPNHTGTMARGEDFDFTYRTDSNGFRNAEPLPESAEIVAVGDSMTFSYGVDDDEAWTTLLDEALPDERVINLGLPGAGPEQYARYFETFGRGLSPELLIVGILPANDVRDERMFQEWVAAGGPGNYDVWRFAGGGDSGRPLLDFLRRSYLMSWIEEARKMSRSRGHYEAQTRTLEGGGVVNLVPSLVASASRDAERGNENFERCVAALDRLRGLAADAGCRVLFVLFPSKEEVYLPLFDAETPQPLGAFQEEFEERGWPYVDLTPAFQEEAERGKKLFFTVDGHPNAAGYAVVAEAVLASLR